MEKIIITDDNGPAIIIMNAVAEYLDKNKTAFFKDYKPNTPGECDVELLVNGHSVPVVATLANFIETFNEVVKRRAGKLALEMVSNSGLEPLQKALQNAKVGIIEALIKVGFEPEDNDWSD